MPTPTTDYTEHAMLRMPDAAHAPTAIGGHVGRMCGISCISWHVNSEEVRSKKPYLQTKLL